MVPARGGSKSIANKNLVAVNGTPLLDYGVRAAQASKRFERIICSTDDDGIAAHAVELGIEADRRPVELATDSAKVDDAAREMLRRLGEEPEILVLVQPTSLFLLAGHIDALLDVMARDKAARSAHTIAPCSHNNHPWNCRENVGGHARFLFREERLKARNKQEKPKFFIFGNLIAARTDALVKGEGFYAEPSAVVEISRPYEFDLDAPEDIAIAEALITAGCVHLPHMIQPSHKIHP